MIDFCKFCLVYEFELCFMATKQKRDIDLAVSVGWKAIINTSSVAKCLRICLK